MKRFMLLSLSVMLFVLGAFAQDASYKFISAEVNSAKSVIILLKTYSTNKKLVEKEAQYAALKIAMFDGVDATIYNKPIIAQGVSALDEHRIFFYDLFDNKLPYYIKSTKMMSGFKKAESGEKSTLYSVEINYIQLKKDLERRKISRQLTNAKQPTIMVIPYTKQGEDIRTILENDVDKRLVLTKIKEAFDSRGCSTIDFVAKLKAIETGNTFNMDNQSDVKSQIIDMSGADIYVEAEIACSQKIVSGQQKPESRVRIIMTAYDAATGMSLSNKIGDSGTFYTNDISKLALKAVSTCADDFLRVMQEKFSSIMENGRSVMVEIGLAEDAQINLESEVGMQGLSLYDEIELWLSEKAYNGDYHIQGSTKTKMIIDDMKIQAQNDEGKAYNLSNLSLDFFKFLKSLGVTISRSTKGNTLYITIK